MSMCRVNGTDLLSLPVPTRSSLPLALILIVEIGTYCINSAYFLPFILVITI